jgi:hypothetical protein
MKPPSQSILAMDQGRECEPHAEHQRQQRRAAIGDQRQRHADDRRKPDHHRDIDADVQSQNHGNAGGEQSRERGARAQRDQHERTQERCIEGQQSERADEARFLREHREDEVGVFFGQKVQLALRAAEKAAALQATRAERDF